MLLINKIISVVESKVKIVINYNPSAGKRGVRPINELIYNEKLEQKEIWLDPKFQCTVYLPNDTTIKFEKLTKNEWRYYELIEKGKSMSTFQIIK